MKVNIDGDFIFDGYATLNVTIHDANEEQKVRNWSYENKIAEFKNWKDLEIKFHVPALYSCNFCMKKAANISDTINTSVLWQNKRTKRRKTVEF